VDFLLDLQVVIKLKKQIEGWDSVLDEIKKKVGEKLDFRRFKRGLEGEVILLLIPKFLPFIKDEPFS